MTNNFLQWNPSANNQEADAAYSADSQRSGGAATDAIFASNLGNKLFYQLSTFVAAMAQSLDTKGYSPNDGSANPSTALVNLESVLANILTNADVLVSASIGNVNGHIKFGSSLGGLTLQWGNASVTLGTTTAITLPIALTYNPAVFLAPNASAAPGNYYVAGQSPTNFQLAAAGSGLQDFFWLAIGS